ncbi:MAG TPA: protein kinase [Acidobacteriaceae bacterium]|nr:protein kinase [Acidobacteriaceae bacterium]
MDQPQPGAVLGHYKIIQRLGAGGMGVVYEAEDLKLGRHVALKLLSATEEPAALERFWREARAASALNHPGICTLYELNESEQQPFLVMELLEGQSLDHLYSGQAVPLNRLIDLGIQIADALDAAHHKGILHRDIKPGNLFVTTTGQVKILDFGLARFEDPASTTTDVGVSARHMITAPGSTLGTIAYMSPEQARGEQVDLRSDIFSLGVVLYEMATGRHPFNGTTTAVVFDKLLNYIPPAPVSLNHELPPEFEGIIAKALEKDRELRYQSAADLRTDLRRMQRSTSGALMGSTAGIPARQTQYEGMTHISQAGAVAAATPVSGSAAGEEAHAGPGAPASPASAVKALRQDPAALSQPAAVHARRRRTFIGPAIAGGLVVVLAMSAAFAIRRMHSRARAQTAAPTTRTAPVTTAAPAAPASAEAAELPAERKPVKPPAAQPEAGPNTSAETRDAAGTKATATRPEHRALPAAPNSQAASAALSGSAAAPTNSATAPTAATGTKSSAFTTVSYPAHHEHGFPFIGGRSCDGTLELTQNLLTFTSKTHPLSLTREQVVSIDGNGVVDSDGRHFHFQVEGMTNKQVHALLAQWLTAGEPTHPAVASR